MDIFDSVIKNIQKNFQNTDSGISSKNKTDDEYRKELENLSTEELEGEFYRKAMMDELVEIKRREEWREEQDQKAEIQRKFWKNLNG